MKSSKATGLDGISCRLLKAASSAIITPLMNLINRSLATGTVPAKWKMAKVTPIFKSRERDDVANYRPISVLPLVSKIIERAVHDQLHTFLKGKGYLADQQSGFRPKHSTQSAVLDVSDHILMNIDDGKVTAFDTGYLRLVFMALNSNGLNLILVIDSRPHTWMASCQNLTILRLVSPRVQLLGLFYLLFL